MKKIIALTSAAILVSSIGAYAEESLATQSAETKAPVAKEAIQSSKIDFNKVSYIIGYEMGQSLKGQDIPLNVNSLQKGIKTALAGKESKLSQEDSKKIMQTFQQEMIQKAQLSLKAESTENSKSSDAFMSAIAQKVPGVKKVTDNIYYQVLTKGKGNAPDKDDMVTVDYTGTTPGKTFSNDKNALEKIKHGELLGHVFDSSGTAGKPAIFPLNQVISCWKDALSQIPVGSEVILYCAPKAAYGEMAPPKIGPNQAVSFKLRLIKATSLTADKKDETKTDAIKRHLKNNFN